MNAANPDSDEPWQRLALDLNAVLNRIGDEDRLAILLRFFQRKPLRDVGAALGVSEDAARMRINRALDKLRGLLGREGMVCSSAILGTMLADQAVQAVPLDARNAVVKASLQAAQAAIPSSGLVHLLAVMAKTKLRSLGVAALALLVVTDAGLFLFNRYQERSHRLIIAAKSPLISARKPSALIPGTKSPTPRAAAFIEPSELEQAIAHLRKVLREDQAQNNGELEKSLKRFGLGIKAAIPILLEGLQDPSPQVAQNSENGFSEFFRIGSAKRSTLTLIQDDAMPYLIDLFRQDTQASHTRAYALRTFHDLLPGAPEMAASAMPALVGMLADPDIEIRREVVNLLSSNCSQAADAVPALANLLSYSATPQEAAAELMRRNPTGPAPDDAAISKEMQQLTINVRCETASTLEHLGSAAQAVGPALRVLLADSEERTRACAAIALWKITGQNELAGVFSANVGASLPVPPYLDRNRSYLWKRQIDALGEMGQSAQVAVPNLLRLSDCSNEEIRGSALAVLDKIYFTAVP
jgi:DNA-binding Lrp family transcriptional regulator